MAESKHTSAPWIVESDERRFYVRSERTQKSGWPEMGFWVTFGTEADARLLAASPEMYEVLSEMRRTGALTRLPGELDQMAMAALYKAEGHHE